MTNTNTTFLPVVDGPTDVSTYVLDRLMPRMAPVVPKTVREIKVPSLLTKILSTKRCHGSGGDSKFRLWLHSELRKLGVVPKIIKGGTIYVATDEKSDTLFSCHVDTRHGMEESKEGATQKLAFDPAFNHLFLENPETSMCLGADNGAGIYLLMELIKAKVPGGYLFHVGEECGGIGARDVLTTNKPLLENYSRAIAFDRKGTEDVVVTQGGQACASIVFGTALCKEFEKAGLPGYEVSHKGTFTDVRLYAHLIPECVNISCGYEREHTSSEMLDVQHLLDLTEACKKIKWDEIKVARVIPVYVPPADLFKSSGPQAWPTLKPKSKSKSKPKDEPTMGVIEEAQQMTYEELLDLDATTTADIIVDLLLEYEAMEARYERMRKLLGIT